jgi:ferric-dicitrate binding protein FerR (iron transport regulator)
VEASQENKLFFAEMKHTWTLSGISSEVSGDDLLSERYKAVLEKIDTGDVRRITKLLPVWRIAASLILTVGITALVSYFIWNKKPENITYHELTVPSGQQAQLTLADGTHIWLNSKSRLTYPGTFASDFREVVLDGEGYFQVSHNPARPFIVKTSHLKIKVLGTSFNVTNYKDENKIVLALETGAISIMGQGSDKTDVKLKPNDMAVYSKISKKIEFSRADTEVYKSWLKGQFKFRNLSFEDITRRLGRNFNVQFIFINNNIKDVKYNGSFYNYEPLSNILKIMQTNSAFRYRIVKDKVYIE